MLTECVGIGGVIQMYDWYERPDGYLIVMERPFPCQDLFDYISDNGPLSETIAKNFFRQVNAYRLGWPLNFDTKFFYCQNDLNLN